MKRLRAETWAHIKCTVASLLLRLAKARDPHQQHRTSADKKVAVGRAVENFEFRELALLLMATMFSSDVVHSAAQGA
jgi:hypothetical protein